MPETPKFVRYLEPTRAPLFPPRFPGHGISNVVILQVTPCGNLRHSVAVDRYSRSLSAITIPHFSKEHRQAQVVRFTLTWLYYYTTVAATRKRVTFSRSHRADDYSPFPSLQPQPQSMQLDHQSGLPLAAGMDPILATVC